MLFANVVLKFSMIIYLQLNVSIFSDMHYIILMQTLQILKIPKQCFDIQEAAIIE